MARAFTGWTIFDPNRYGEFHFNPAMHDRGEKVVLGRTFPRGGGEEEGVKIIDTLAAHPSTARFISRKLAQRFVADEPPQALVDRMAATFTKTSGDLKAVMETLLFSREFLSDGAWQAKVKTPFELVTSAIRALDAELTDTTAVSQRLTEMGQPTVRQRRADRLREHRRSMVRLRWPDAPNRLCERARRRPDRRRESGRERHRRAGRATRAGGPFRLRARARGRCRHRRGRGG